MLVSISNKALSLVLGKEVQSLDPNIIVDNNDIRELSYIMVVLKDDEDQLGKSVAYVTDHIARLCKEYILGQPKIHGMDIYIEVNLTALVEVTGCLYNTGTCETELEAIIKATEWVVSNV